MTITFDVKKSWRDRISAVVHIDGTARPHVVKKSVTPSYYKIIEEYEKLTGIPVILNTSFNLHEEPIVCKPEDAVRAFEQGRLDALAIGNIMISKKDGERPI
jgi:carbamoyltransferase